MISQLHNCGATYVKTVSVHEVLRGETVWQGDVEMFDLTGHPKAKRAYAWGHLDGAMMSGRDSLPCWKSRQWIQRKRPCRFKLLKTQKD
jgi:hypothetical protein